KKNLENIGVAEKYYRGAVASDILSKKVQDYISQRDVKNEMPQSHLEGILIDVKAPADEATTAEENTEGQVEIKAVINENPAKIRETIKARLDAGEDFAALAEEFSKDSGSRVKGGDLGWMPRDLLSGEFAKAAFDSEVGVMGQPIPISASADNTQYWLVKVLERQESRPLEENQRQTLQNKAFNDWFTEQRKTLTIVNDLLNPDLRALAITKALS
ncbi:MAG: peptidylprolyl isomerase, partial [Dehalococcoidia bacterium]